MPSQRILDELDKKLQAKKVGDRSFLTSGPTMPDKYDFLPTESQAAYHQREMQKFADSSDPLAENYYSSPVSVKNAFDYADQLRGYGNHAYHPDIREANQLALLDESTPLFYSDGSLIPEEIREADKQQQAAYYLRGASAIAGADSASFYPSSRSPISRTDPDSSHVELPFGLSEYGRYTPEASSTEMVRQYNKQKFPPKKAKKPRR